MDSDDANDSDCVTDDEDDRLEDDELSNAIPTPALVSPAVPLVGLVTVSDSLVIEDARGSGEISMLGADGVSRADDSSRRPTSVLRFRLGGIHLLVAEMQTY